MDRWRSKVALVTGASTGIGKAIVEKLMKNGMKVVGCARREELLTEMGKELDSLGELTLIRCDVSKEEDVAAMFETIKEKYGGLDACINNAGINRRQSLLTGSPADWEAMFSVNVLGLMRVTQAAVASMRVKGATEGHVININSLVGHKLISISWVNSYATTKHAVRAITEGLRQELLALQPDFLCRVSQISPGAVDTPMTEGLRSSKAMDASDVADAVIFQLSLPPHVQIHDIIMCPTSQTF